MSTVKKRIYRSELRKARASETRGRILLAARKLFERRGIQDVTIPDLAREAGVSAPTVFALFKSKVGLVRTLIEETLFGERYRAMVEGALSADDPVERLRRTAALSRSTYDVERSEIGLIRGASALSPELRSLEQANDRRRYKRQAPTLVFLFKKKALGPGLDLRQARDVMWALTGRDIYRMLVIERGWSSAAYERWLAAALIKALLKYHE